MKKLISLIFFFVALSASAQTLSTAKTAVATVVPTIDTNIYASGDALGGKLTVTTLNSPISAIISDVIITDLDAEAEDIDVVFFSQDPSATTVTNNVAVDIADADADEIICTVEVRDHVTFADNGVSFATNQNCPFVGSTLYAVMIVRGTPTYTSASDLTLRVGLLKD